MGSFTARSQSVRGTRRKARSGRLLLSGGICLAWAAPAWSAPIHDLARFKWVLLGSFLALASLLLLVLVRLWHELRGERNLLIPIPADLLDHKTPFVPSRKGVGALPGTIEEWQSQYSTETAPVTSSTGTDMIRPRVDAGTEIYERATPPAKKKSPQKLEEPVVPARRADDVEPPPVKEDDPWHNLLGKPRDSDPARRKDAIPVGPLSVDTTDPIEPAFDSTESPLPSPPSPSLLVDPAKRGGDGTGKINNKVLRLELTREKRDTRDQDLPRPPAPD